MQTIVAEQSSPWITDLNEIRERSETAYSENLKFAQCLKSKNPADLEKKIIEISRNVAGGIDCKKCANCCRSLTVAPNYPDIAKLACSLNLETSDFKKKYMKRDDEGDMVFKQRPCPLLKNNMCSVYENRPTTCRTYPHLEKGNFMARLGNVISNLGVCPIAYNSFEILKLTYE